MFAEHPATFSHDLELCFAELQAFWRCTGLERTTHSLCINFGQERNWSHSCVPRKVFSSF